MKTKIKFYQFFLLWLFFGTVAYAQLPEVSTAENPKWYYLQVEGSGSNREGLTFTVSGNYVSGDVLSTTNQTKKNNQLFRFENAGDGNYYIISKSKNQRLDAVINTDMDDSGLGFSETGVGFIIRQVPGTHYYYMEVSRIPTGGNASYKYVHQANYGTPKGIILTSTTYYHGMNSQYAFVPEEQVNLEYSSGELAVYYHIKSAVPQHNTICVTDISENESSMLNLAIENTDQSNKAQEWKIVQKSGTSRVNLINRKTGNIIQTASGIGEFFNQTLFTQDENESNGWTLSYHRAGQFVVSGIEEDGITRYWTFTEANETPALYDAANLSFSSFSWKFERVNPVETNIKDIESGQEYRVYVNDRRVFVEGETQFELHNLQGARLNKSKQLTPGVYLVRIGRNTVKVLVK